MLIVKLHLGEEGDFFFLVFVFQFSFLFPPVSQGNKHLTLVHAKRKNIPFNEWTPLSYWNCQMSETCSHCNIFRSVS